MSVSRLIRAGAAVPVAVIDPDTRLVQTGAALPVVNVGGNITRFVFSPYAAEFPAANFPQLQLVNRRPVLSFDDSTNETCYWTVITPRNWSEGKVAYIYFIMASAIAGDVDIDVAVEAITPGDAVDLDATTSFDNPNSTDGTTVPGTAGYLAVIAVALTNNDNSRAGDYLRFALTRDAANDTATGDMHVLAVEIRDGV